VERSDNGLLLHQSEVGLRGELSATGCAERFLKNAGHLSGVERSGRASYYTSSERDLRGELPATSAEGLPGHSCNLAVWSEAT
jgi:hypothetical protein